MLWSEYMDEVKSDAMDAIKENLEYNDSWDEMYDSLFMDDSVTAAATIATATKQPKPLAELSLILTLWTSSKRWGMMVSPPRKARKLVTLSRVAFVWGLFLASWKSTTTA